MQQEKEHYFSTKIVGQTIIEVQTKRRLLIVNKELKDDKLLLTTEDENDRTVMVLIRESDVRFIHNGIAINAQIVEYPILYSTTIQLIRK